MNEWWKESVIYHIYPMGFCGAPKENDFRSPAEHRIKKIKELAPKLKDLGCGSLLLGPVFESTSHGYDIVDYYHIDRRLGNNRSFTETVNTMKNMGFRIILDAVFHHTGRDFWAFYDLREKKEASPYRNWFSGVNFGSRSPYGDPFSYDAWEGHFSLVKLNLSSAEVKHHLFKAVEKWIIEWGIDGLRLDTAYCLDTAFIEELNEFCKRIRPGFWLMGEAIHGDYRNWAGYRKLDSVTNYECYKGLYSSHNDKNYFEIAYSLNRQFGDGGIYKDLNLYNFIDNHDVSRAASIMNEKENLIPLYTLLFTIPGTPSIYYGSEEGQTGIKTPGSDWNLRPAADEINGGDRRLFSHIQAMIRLRQKYKALRLGKYRQLSLSHQLFSFERKYEEERIVTAVNSDQREAYLTIPGNEYLEMTDAFSGDHVRAPYHIPPHGCRVFRCL